MFGMKGLLRQQSNFPDFFLILTGDTYSIDFCRNDTEWTALGLQSYLENNLGCMKAICIYVYIIHTSVSVLSIEQEKFINTGFL